MEKIRVIISNQQKAVKIPTGIRMLIRRCCHAVLQLGAKILGDIVISVPKAMEQAKTYGHSFEREMGFLTAHSMLHLLGYDHEAGGLARVRMREKEEQVMRELGLPASASYATTPRA